MNVEPGTKILVGDRAVPMPATRPGDRVIAVHRTGDLLVVPAPELEVATAAAERAHEAFRAMAGVSDDQVTAFFRLFSDRLADDATWSAIAAANAGDVERARSAGRPTGRLEATTKVRDGMIEGLLGWAKADVRIGEVVERRDGDTWTVERRRAPLGVVAFVFEGRPNVFADGAGVLRGGNTCVMRIGSDALGTAMAIEERAIAPAIEGSGLPDGALTLVRSREHASAWALFTMPQVRLAVARGSGRAVAVLGSIAEQHGIPASLHGTGGAWLYLADDAPDVTARNAIVHSLDRKVCNTLNVLVVDASCVQSLGPVVADALSSLRAKVHVAPGAEAIVSGEEITAGELATEWEWDEVPEVSVAVADGLEEAAVLIDAWSPRFVASIVTADEERFERFYRLVDAPYVGRGFTRWVDGQWAWGRPELGLTNWERGRLLGRSGILAGDDVCTIRDVFVDRTGEAGQTR